MEKCRRGVSWKASVASYILNGIERTLTLEADLKGGSYKPRAPKTFMVTRPKQREIVSIAFRDRVYQRSLNDNVLYPAVTRGFIWDNCACQKGKGTDKARQRLGCHMQRAWRTWGTGYYVLQVDIKSYYATMRHDVAKDVLRRRLPPEAYQMAAGVLDGQYPGEVGYNPGSQMVQLCGIAVPDALDHYIKERLRIRGYVRYMDDLILLHGDKGYLEYCRAQIEARLSELGFTAHPKKTRIYPISKGIPFLGFVHRLSETGRVYRLVNPRNVRDERRRLRRLAALARRGGLTKTKADHCYQGWRTHAAKGNSHGLLVRMDAYYKSLWRDSNG